MTDQSNSKSELWSRLSLEGLVIVVSILLAFALDTAWDDRQENIRRDEYLSVLGDEFRAAAEEMQEQIGDHERQVRSIETMLKQLGDANVRKRVEKQAELFEGRGGGVLWTASAKTGDKTAELELDTIPVFDGMAAARGRLYMTCVNGSVKCFAEK